MHQTPRLDSSPEDRPVAQIKRLRLLWIIGGSFGALAIGIVTYLALSTLLPVQPQHQARSVDVRRPFVITLNQKLLRIPTDKIEVTPSIAGSWQYIASLTGENKLVFTQAEPLMTATTYKVKINDARRITGVAVDIPPVQFTTESAPGVARTSLDGVDPVAADGVISVQLATPNRGLRKLVLATTPAVPLITSVVGDKTFSWKPTSYWPQGKKVTIELRDENAKTTLFKKTATIAAAPRISQPVKEANFGKNDVARVEFAEPMEQKDGAVTFSLPGTGRWKSDRVYEFSPKEVEPGKTYTYTLIKGARSKSGGIVDKDITRKFSTPGRVAVIAMSPRGGELSQKQQEIKFTFNQPVDRKSAEVRMKLSRGTEVSKTWQGNTLIVTARNFGMQETVRATMEPGVQPIFGLVSTARYGVSFSTEMPVKKLSAPMYYQQYAQSCEAASVRMALGYKGAGSLSDWSILQRFGYRPRPLDKKNNIWDDPQKQFVGDVKGKQEAGTGWGVYAEPVARAVRSYGRGAAVQYGVTAEFVSSQVYAGNPVVLWGVWNESAVQKSWKTPDGKTVRGPVPMHVRLVVGVKGKASNPVGFYIHDPITGPAYWTKDAMLHNVNRAGAANQAVAVQ